MRQFFSRKKGSLDEVGKQAQSLDLGDLSLEEGFDYIYSQRIWAGGTTMYSGEGSYGVWAERFVNLLKEFMKSHKIDSITDIGCGDFNIGSQICSSVTRYEALDVSGEIIKINKERFNDLPNVSFRQSNACADLLPSADLAIIRQVLQHLSNVQIEALLQNVAKSGFKFVIVAEHVPGKHKLRRPNVDLLSHSAGIRLQVGSGVYIDKPPFSRPARQIDQFESEDGQLAVFLWRLPASSNLQQT